MDISKNFRKAPWLRRVHPDKVNNCFACNYKPHSYGGPDNSFVELTAADFLNELSPAAHPINSTFMSLRPIWKKTEETKGGKEKWVIDGYDELESVALGWQQFIAGNKVSHLTGSGGFSIASESKDDGEDYDSFRSWLDAIGVSDAFKEAVTYAEHAGDSGILFYQDANNDILWEVYAYEKGHTIYPQEDATGNPIYYISYRKNGRNMCDIISTKSIEKWAAAKPDNDDDKEFLESLAAGSKDKKLEFSDDGYVLVKRTDSQAGQDMVQFVYFWVPDVPWGPAQLSIEAHENAASYVANEVKDSAFPLLVVKSEKVSSLPPTSVNGKTIAIKGTSDSLAHSDVKYETPGDASNIATVHFKELNDNIIRTTMTAIITPDIMKQGADSSTSIKILFRPEIEWAQQRWIYYNKPVRQMVALLKVLCGKAEGALDRYTKLRTSVWQEIWLPQNEKERVEIITQKVYARILSRKNALNELGSPYKGDYETINQEWAEELAMKQKYSAKVEDDPNPDKTDVNNQDPGKSIQD